VSSITFTVSMVGTVPGDFDYELGGAGYGLQRRTDPSVAAAVWRGLGDARTVVNVGAKSFRDGRMTVVLLDQPRPGWFATAHVQRRRNGSGCLTGASRFRPRL
jgi:hypothetical protein